MVDPSTQARIMNESQLKNKSVYTDNKTVPNRRPKADSSKTLRRLQQQIETLQSQNATRKENTPSLVVGSESLDLVYTGKIAGKTAQRAMPVFKHEQMQTLKALLDPVVGIMNAALKAKSFDPIPLKDKGQQLADDKGNPIYRANALDKAQYAYSRLFQNESFVNKLKELGQVVESIIENQPPVGTVKTYSIERSVADKPKVNINPPATKVVDKSRPLLFDIPEINVSDVEDDGPDL